MVPPHKYTFPIDLNNGGNLLWLDHMYLRNFSLYMGYANGRIFLNKGWRTDKSTRFLLQLRQYTEFTKLLSSFKDV